MPATASSTQFSSKTSSALSIMEEGNSSPFQHPGDVRVLELPTIAHKILAEVAGTFILVFAGCASVLIDQGAKAKLTPVGVAGTWGLAIMVVIYTLGHVSDAHVNPAVTIAFLVCRRFPLKHVPGYVAAQIVGATAASLILKALFGGNKIHAAVTLPAAGTNDLEVIVWEFIISFILMLVICGVATDDRAINQLSGVAIGGTVLFNGLIAGQVTGASMNPARSIGPALVATDFNSLWLYIVGPILGTISGAMFYSLLRLRDINSSKQ